MSTRTRRLLSLSALGTAVSLGTAWGTAKANLKDKADRSELGAKADTAVVNRLVRHAVIDSMQRSSDHELLLRIDARVTAIYCAGKPPGCN